MRAAIVSGVEQSNWVERHLVARRFAGAVASTVDDVHLLHPGLVDRARPEGVFTVRTFAAVGADLKKARAMERILFGPVEEEIGCRCGNHPTDAHDDLDGLDEYLLGAREGQAAGLLDVLREERFEILVLVGAASAHVLAATRIVDPAQRIVLVPACASPHEAALPAVREVAARANVLALSSAAERDLWTPIVGPSKCIDVGFPSRVNDIAVSTPPFHLPDLPYLAVAGDWRRPAELPRLRRWAKLLEEDAGVTMRAVGAGGRHLGDELAFGTGTSRMDAWRWFTKALAVLQPAPHLPVAALSAEAMAFGVPIIAPETGGASRAYAEASNGGLWFRSYGELLGATRALLEGDLREQLGRQAAQFAEATFADSCAYVERVTKAIGSLD